MEEIPRLNYLKKIIVDEGSHEFGNGSLSKPREKLNYGM